MTPLRPRNRAAIRVEPLERRDQPAAVPPGAFAVGAPQGGAPDVTLIDFLNDLH